MKITLKRDGQKPLRFEGEEIATIRSSSNNASSWYSGSPGRWESYTLYRTDGGNMVGEKYFATSWQGEHDSVQVKVFKGEEKKNGTFVNTAEIVEFFGLGWLAQELYGRAGLDIAEEIE